MDSYAVLNYCVSVFRGYSESTIYFAPTISTDCSNFNRPSWGIYSKLDCEAVYVFDKVHIVVLADIDLQGSKSTIAVKGPMKNHGIRQSGVAPIGRSTLDQAKPPRSMQWPERPPFSGHRPSFKREWWSQLYSLLFATCTHLRITTAL